jgi:hypothetical protein
MQINSVAQAGLLPALLAVRLPHNSQDKSDSIIIDNQVITHVGEKDINLLKKLVRAGDEHGKATRGFVFYLDISAPRYWWQEMATYRIGVECLSSESTMHNEAKGLTGEELQKIKGEIKESLIQRRILMFSLQTLRRIYIQRRPHRLPEWQQFCRIIEELDTNNYGLILTDIKDFK